MKKYILVAIAFIACLFSITNVAAQTRTKVKEGVYLVSYGDTFVIEDEVNQRSVQFQVEQKQDESGRPVYDILCGNKVTKEIVKTALKGAISSVLVSSGVASWVIPFANTVAGLAYDSICDYYK